MPDAAVNRAENAPPQVRVPSRGIRCVAEIVGTFLLVLLGCGAVHSAVLTGAQSGLWQVAIVWGVAIMLAAFAVGGISGAHINPAMSIALAAWGRFAWRDVPAYIGSQMAGAFLAAAALYVMYGPQLASHEVKKQVVRGEPGSEITAMCYGEYFPNPGPVSTASGRYSSAAHDELSRLVPPHVAFFAEVLGTFVLALVVFAVTDGRNAGSPGAGLAPVFIGLTVAVLISIIAPLTQACFNPARDMGPRLFAYLAGWKSAAFPGRNGWHCLTVYVAAPILGAWLGAAFHERILRPPPAS